MPDTKVSALTDGTTANSTDRIPVARDAGGGTFNNRYVTPGYIGTTLLGSGTALTGATVTTSSPVLNLTQTWNNGAVTFSGIKLNVTASASAGGSKLLDIQQGGSPLVLVTSGNGPSLRVSNVSALYGNQFITDYGNWYLGGSVSEASGTVSSSALVFQSSSGIKIRSSHAYGWVSGTDATAAADLVLTRAAAATLQLGAADTTGTTAPTAQFLRVQSWSSSTTNNQTGADFTIQGSRGTGTGAGGSIIFQVAPAGGSSNGVQNAYSTALTIASNSSVTFASGITATGVISAAGLSLGGSNPVINIGGGTLLLNNDISLGARANGIFIVSSGGAYTFSPSTAYNASPDLFLYRDAANTLALRNGGTVGTPVPQTFNIYNFYTDTNNYERLSIKVDTNGVTFSNENLGTGFVRGIRFSCGGLVGWSVSPSRDFLAGADNAYDIGASGANRPRNVYVGTGVTIGTMSVNFRIINSGNGVIAFDGANTYKLNSYGYANRPDINVGVSTFSIIDGNGSSKIAFSTTGTIASGGYTVATLPAAGTAGRTAYVTDATAPTYLGALTGGGAVVCPVFDNGTAWVSA